MSGIYLDNVRVLLNLRENDANEMMPDGLNGRLIVLIYMDIQLLRWCISTAHCMRSYTPPSSCHLPLMTPL
jgi:hypothetical protein